MAANNHINYIEFKATDLLKTKQFYSSVFGWKFTDYGDAYISFEDPQLSGITGGFELTAEPLLNGALIVIYHDELELVQQKVENAGGQIKLPIFSFPGGKRFQFIDPNGNELAVWTELND